ncbi:ferritin-like domain-containing protein [Spiroplasma endosymbiont of Atherix ibis]|uniref:ferritin-like domain-containing protein n=1 Tax=Spiroplasma endosymbiont of Atherix ibis TaxID=3066291 RepID=UPI0030D0B895
MDKLILINLQDYINEHIKMQLNCFNLSKKSDELGYPGFTHFFQVQAQDEFLHQRRIMNYLLDRGQNYKINSIEVNTPELKNIEDILNVEIILQILQMNLQIMQKIKWTLQQLNFMNYYN